MTRFPGVKRGSTFLPSLFLTLIFLVTGLLLYRYAFPKTIVSPIDTSGQKKNILPLFTKRKDPEELKRLVRQTVNMSLVDYSVFVVDVNSDFRMGINETQMFTGASVNKIPILAALYTEAQQGKVDLDEVLTLQENDIQDYGTGSIRYAKPGSTYTIKTLAKLMMQQSDNTAAYILGNLVLDLNTIEQMVTGWGMTQTDMVNNKTSNSDMAIIMKKIYSGNIANPALTQEMFAFFKDTDFEDRIPGLLPKDVTVYHKIGNEIGVVHDVGVVVGPTTKYYIGIMTNGVTDEEKTVKLMAQISKTVYDYMK